MVSIEVSGKSLKVRIPGPFDYAVGDEVSVHHEGPVRFFAEVKN
jgi:virulence-associated protein VagC